jgi:DNA-binding winged helix-turn-helix (wHTH) protein
MLCSVPLHDVNLGHEAAGFEVQINTLYGRAFCYSNPFRITVNEEKETSQDLMNVGLKPEEAEIRQKNTKIK